MRKLLFFASLFLLPKTFGFCQKNNSRTKEKFIGQASFIAEGGGPGIAFSANLDRRFSPGRLGWGGRIGVGFVSAYDDYYDPVNMVWYGGDQK